MGHRRAQFGNTWYIEIERGHWRRFGDIVYNGKLIPYDENGNLDYEHSIDVNTITEVEEVKLESPMGYMMGIDLSSSMDFSAEVKINSDIFDKFARNISPNPVSPEEHEKRLETYGKTDV